MGGPEGEGEMNPSPLQFALALVILAIPAALLQESNREAAWAYVFLILLSFIVFQWPGLSRFAAFVRRELHT